MCARSAENCGYSHRGTKGNCLCGRTEETEPLASYREPARGSFNEWAEESQPYGIMHALPPKPELEAETLDDDAQDDSNDVYESFATLSEAEVTGTFSFWQQKLDSAFADVDVADSYVSLHPPARTRQSRVQTLRISHLETSSAHASQSEPKRASRPLGVSPKNRMLGIATTTTPIITRYFCSADTLPTTSCDMQIQSLVNKVHALLLRDVGRQTQDRRKHQCLVDRGRSDWMSIYSHYAMMWHKMWTPKQVRCHYSRHRLLPCSPF